MMLSSMMRGGIKVAATLGGGAAGFWGVSGSRKERMLQAIVGMGAGYAASSLALSMVPAAPAMESPPVEP